MKKCLICEVVKASQSCYHIKAKWRNRIDYTSQATNRQLKRRKTNLSSAPDREASSKSSLRYSPLNTALVPASAKSNAVFPSVFLILVSAPCCSNAGKISQYIKTQVFTFTVYTDFFLSFFQMLINTTITQLWKWFVESIRNVKILISYISNKIEIREQCL